MSFQGTINQGIGAIGALAGVKKVVEGQQASNELAEKTNELAKDQVAATEKQTEAINKQTDKVASIYNQLPSQGEQLVAAQASRKAIESLMNAQYPYRNLKGWSPEKQLKGQSLADYNALNNSLLMAKEDEMNKAKEIGLAVHTTQPEGDEK